MTGRAWTRSTRRSVLARGAGAYKQSYPKASLGRTTLLEMPGSQEMQASSTTLRRIVLDSNVCRCYPECPAVFQALNP